MSHANATLTPRTRLRLAKLIVDDKWTYAAAAKMFMVAPRTAKKWADRYRSEGPAGMADRSSKPRTSPNRTRPELVRKIVRLRWRNRLGPIQIGGRLGIPASTVHAVPVRCRINRPQTNGKIERFHRASSSGRGRSAQGAGVCVSLVGRAPRAHLVRISRGIWWAHRRPRRILVAPP